MQTRLPKLTPSGIQRVTFVVDVLILVAASFAASSGSGEVHWKVALAMSATAAAVWAIASRVLRHYDVTNGRGFLGDIALTLVLLVTVAIPLMLLRPLVSHYAMT